MKAVGEGSDVFVGQDGHVALIEIRRPPNNFFDQILLADIADALEALDRDPKCRAVVLAAQGKSFCAGADLARGNPLVQEGAARKLAPHLYLEAARMFRSKKPIVAAVQGAATGGGLGLALMPDFRVASPSARFWANFTKLGFHCGFGLSLTLPRLVGEQKASLLLLGGQRVTGEEAVAMGMADILATDETVRERAIELAREIAGNSPLAVASMRHTLRRGLAEAVEAATERELVEQGWQRQTEDFKEGVKAMAERRAPNFVGR